MKACFMGLGYIGLPTAIIAAQSGIEVIGVDINPHVVELTNQGIIHIVEPGLQELCQQVVRSGKLKARTEPEECDAYFIVVPTPFKGNHEPDISYVESATRAVVPYLKENEPFCDRIHIAGGNHGEDGKPDFFSSTGIKRQDIHCLLSRAGSARQCDLRTRA